MTGPTNHAVAVVFNFVQPLVALRRRVDQLRELRRDPLRPSGRTPRNALPRRFDQFGRHFEQLLADARFAVDSPLEQSGFELCMGLFLSSGCFGFC